MSYWVLNSHSQSSSLPTGWPMDQSLLGPLGTRRNADSQPHPELLNQDLHCNKIPSGGSYAHPRLRSTVRCDPGQLINLSEPDFSHLQRKKIITTGALRFLQVPKYCDKPEQSLIFKSDTMTLRNTLNF